jgi:uncharacterized paraquat-inducible protein A
MKIERDKELHFWAGVTVSIFTLIIFKAVDAPYCHLWVAGFTIAAALGKEVKDLMDYGKFDYRDAVYTIAGGALAFVLSFF